MICVWTFVCDTHPDISIKNSEQSRRSSVGGSICTRILYSDQPCPKQWKKYLSLGSNKEDLIEFLFNQWKQDSYSPYYKGKLYLTHGEFCYSLEVNNEHVICTEVSKLCCSHKEADTWLLLHASQESYRNIIIIQTPDTDVAVIACSVSHQIYYQLLLHTGTKHRRRFIDISFNS